MEDASEIVGTKGTPGFSAVRNILLSSQELARTHKRLSLKREPHYEQAVHYVNKAEWERLAQDSKPLQSRQT